MMFGIHDLGGGEGGGEGGGGGGGGRGPWKLAHLGRTPPPPPLKRNSRSCATVGLLSRISRPVIRKFPVSKHSLCFETQPLFRNMDVTATTASQNDIQSHLGSSAISEGCDVTCASKRISAHSILASPGPTGHVLMMWVLIM